MSLTTLAAVLALGLTPSSPTLTIGEVASLNTQPPVHENIFGDTPTYRADFTVAQVTGEGRTIFHPPVKQGYTISASNLKGVAQYIKQHRKGNTGETKWSPTCDVKTSNGKVIDATVDVPITITMPEWSGFAGASGAARGEWERFITALDTHEQGHVLLVGEMLRGLGESMVGKSKSAALGICTKKFSDLKKASKKYDSTTGHGRVQGAVINTSIE